MMLNDWSRRLFRPDLEHPTDDDVAEVLGDHHLLDTPWVTPIDVSHAVLFLASDEARYVPARPPGRRRRARPNSHRPKAGRRPTVAASIDGR